MDKHIEVELEELQNCLLDYKDMLPIDSMQLDEECRRQPEKFDIIGQIATQAKSLARKAKDTLDYIEAKIKSDVRKNPESFGIVGKVTNDAVNETVVIQDELRQAKQDYIDISRIADSFSILVNSMEQRKAMLRDLVSLYVHKYYYNQELMGEQKSLDKDFEEEIAEQRARRLENG